MYPARLSSPFPLPSPPPRPVPPFFPYVKVLYVSGTIPSPVAGGVGA